jgi:two-component system, chemotaxis family, sensor kinase CheA
MSEQDELRDAFLRDTAPLVAQVGERLLAIERSVEAISEDWRQVLGLLHTIKGNSGMMQVEPSERLAHAMERRAAAARDAPSAQQVAMLGPLISSAAALEDAINGGEHVAIDALIAALDAEPGEGGANSAAAARAAAQAVALAGAHQRVPYIRMEAEVLDRMLEVVGELVICLRRVRARRERTGLGDDATSEAVDLIQKHVAEMRQRVLDARLVPLQVVVSRLSRLVRDLGSATGKRLSLKVEGSDTVVDKAIADQLGEPLLHLIRNAADHGIETPDERLAAGKPEVGRLELRILPSGGDLLVRLRDDGRGLSRERLAAEASRRGIDTANLSERALYELIFHPDFSTAKQVTRISGRGVGMLQIKRTVERMGGELTFTTREGQGTEFSLRVPLAAAIRRTLVVGCAGELYAVPIETVVETFRVDLAELFPVDQGWVTSWRDRVLPSQYLARQLGAGGQEPGEGSLCVVIEEGGRHAGVIVDEIVGQQEVVVRDLDPALGRPRGIAGVAIVGEGSVAMVLEPKTLPFGDGRRRGLQAAEAIR